MSARSRLRDGLETWGLLAIPTVLIILGLAGPSREERVPGESRLAHHLRTCRNCRPGPNSLEHPLECPPLVALLKRIQDEAPDDATSRGRRPVAPSPFRGKPFLAPIE